MVNDVNRIQPFCVEFAYTWENRCADWSFSYLVTRVFEYAMEHENKYGKELSELNDRDFMDAMHEFFAEEDQRDLKRTIQCKDCRYKPRKETATHTCLTKYFTPEFQRKQIKGCSRGMPRDEKWEEEVERKSKRVRDAISTRQRRADAKALGIEKKEKRIGKGPTPVVCFDGDKKYFYKSVTMASEETGVPHGNIVDICMGKRKSAYGLKFMYRADYKRKQNAENARRFREREAARVEAEAAAALERMKHD